MRTISLFIICLLTEIIVFGNTFICSSEYSKKCKFGGGEAKFMINSSNFSPGAKIDILQVGDFQELNTSWVTFCIEPNDWAPRYTGNGNANHVNDNWTNMFEVTSMDIENNILSERAFKRRGNRNPFAEYDLAPGDHVSLYVCYYDMNTGYCLSKKLAMAEVICEPQKGLFKNYGYIHFIIKYDEINGWGLEYEITNSMYID
jgi:hypothetical protein